MVIVQSTDSYAINKGGSIGFAGKYNTGGSIAAWGQIGGRKENSTDGNYASYMQFSTRANGASLTEKMRITSDGKVGIGTSNPSDLSSTANDLVIGSGSGGAGMTIYTGTGNQGQIRFADGTSGDAEYRGRIEYDHSSDTLYLGTSGTTPVQIADNGLIYGHYAGKVNVQITNNTVYSFTPASTKGTMLVYCTDDAGDHIYQWFSYEVGSSKWARAFLTNGYVILTTFTGAPSGTSTTSGYLTLGPSSDGKLYIVNRSGLGDSQAYWSIVMIGR